MSRTTHTASQDATFADGAVRPLRLLAFDTDDLAVVAALTQDAVFLASEMAWRPRERRFALLLNRFRWEERDRQPPERVRSMLVIGEVTGIASDGVERGADTVLSLLSVSFEPGPDGTGHVLLTLAGDGAIRVAVEALDVQLRDVTRPYVAPSGKAPHHD